LYFINFYNLFSEIKSASQIKTRPAMAPLRQFLLLFLIGFASTSILRPHEIRAESDESLRISARDDVGTIAVRSTLQSTSVDNKGLGVVVRTEPDLVERDPTPSALLLRDDSDLNAPGVKRQAGFTSPSNRRKLLVGLGSNIITSAFWTLEFHVTKTAQSVSSFVMDEWYCPDLSDSWVVTSLESDTSRTPYLVNGNTDFTLSGYTGTAEIVVKFTASVWGSVASCYIVEMVTDPTCTLAGASVPVTSWSFNDVSATD
jgi:hypothetical protein